MRLSKGLQWKIDPKLLIGGVFILVGAGFFVLRIASEAFKRRPGLSEIANVANLIYEAPFGHPFFATSLAKNPEKYAHTCNPQDSIFVKTSTWMLIPGPTVEVCIISGADGSTQTGKIYPARSLIGKDGHDSASSEGP